MSNAEFEIACAIDRHYAQERKLKERYNELMLKPFLSALEQKELIHINTLLQEMEIEDMYIN